MQGLITALITPFCDDTSLDEAGLRSLIHRQLEAQVDGIVVLGTTGEAPTLSAEEATRVIQIAVEEAKDRTQIIVGTGSNSTQQTIESTQRAHDLGADAALVVTPYYNKPTQEGLFQHFSLIAEQGDLPLILYHHPGRCGISLEVETLRKLAPLKNIAAIKEASGSIQTVSEFIAACPELPLFSGDDSMTLPTRSLGGDGVISVLSNLYPIEMRQLCYLPLDEAIDLHYDLLDFFLASCLESNPIAIKAMMRHCNLPAGPCRLPLCGPSPTNNTYLENLLEKRRVPCGATQPQHC